MMSVSSIPYNKASREITDNWDEEVILSKVKENKQAKRKKIHHHLQFRKRHTRGNISKHSRRRHLPSHFVVIDWSVQCGKMRHKRQNERLLDYSTKKEAHCCRLAGSEGGR